MSQKFNYAAFVYSQRDIAGAPKFCLFHAKVSEILQWADIQRLSKNDPVAVQRDPKKTRILGIKRFLSREPRNTIPTAIVLTLDNIETTPVAIDDKVDPALLIAESGLVILAISLPDVVSGAGKLQWTPPSRQ